MNDWMRNATDAERAQLIAGQQNAACIHGRIRATCAECAAPGEEILQFDDYETSTRTCPCGASFSWSGFDDALAAWMEKHKPHARCLAVG